MRDHKNYDYDPRENPTPRTIVWGAVLWISGPIIVATIVAGVLLAVCR